MGTVQLLKNQPLQQFYVEKIVNQILIAAVTPLFVIQKPEPVMLVRMQRHGTIHQPKNVKFVRMQPPFGIQQQKSARLARPKRQFGMYQLKNVKPAQVAAL